MNDSYEQLNINPADVARYILLRANEDGDIISPLRMQKLVYYAYAITLARTNKQLFSEEIQAWRNGPVIPSLYKLFKELGSNPIPAGFLENVDYAEFDSWVESIFPPDVIEQLDSVYKEYIRKSPYDLVITSHNEAPWRNAREGLAPTDNSQTPISNADMVVAYA